MTYLLSQHYRLVFNLRSVAAHFLNSRRIAGSTERLNKTHARNDIDLDFRESIPFNQEEKWALKIFRAWQECVYA